jgi:streptogramin lyase
MLSYGNKGAIFGYNLGTNSFKTFVLPRELNSPVGMVVDKSGNLWVTNAGTSMFYKLDTTKGNIVKFVTSKASPRIYGGSGVISNIVDERNTQVQNPDNTTTNSISKNAYTLPYWIQKASDGSLWFNEQEGNKIARFDPSNMKLIEYWVPTQNRLWGNCGSNHTSSTTSSSNNTDINIAETCGIANVLQFSLGSYNNNKDNHKDKNNANQVWFTEWTENKIAKLDVKKQLPFSVFSTPNKELTIKRGESREIKVKVTTPSVGALHSSSSSPSNSPLLT